MYLDIKNLKLNKYQINLQFNNNEVVGIFSKDKKLVKEYLDFLSGINPTNNKCLYQGLDVFNNKEYFKDRIYMDFSRKYLSTLKVKYLEERLTNKYKLNFNKEIFLKVSKDLDVRGETEITYIYKFSKSGNTFVNFALLSAIDKRNIIINNPTINLNMVTDIEYITEKIVNKAKYNSVILGIDNLRVFNYLLDRVIIFTDTYEILDINPFEDSFIVFNEENRYIRNVLFKGPNLITLNHYSKDELKLFSKERIDYKKISIYELESYLHGAL